MVCMRASRKISINRSIMTLDDLRLRHSVRTYSPAPLDPSQIRTLNAVITDINTHQSGMHFQLVTDSPDPFKGFSKSYGMFRNARNYVACVVDKSYSNYLERGGYFGMQILMRAFTLGLGTCFVSGTFSAKDVEARVRPGEELLFLIVLGKEAEDGHDTFMASLMHKMSHRHSGLTPMDFLDTKLPWEKICDAFPLLLKGLEAVSYAPSAMNRQPVGILIKKAADPHNPLDTGKKSNKKLQHRQDLSSRYDSLLHKAAGPSIQTETSPAHGLVLQAYVPQKKDVQLIDLGIAMYSFQAAFPGSWTWGNPATFHPDE